MVMLVLFEYTSTALLLHKMVVCKCFFCMRDSVIWYINRKTVW
jgi:hypothetical protein